jgi:hypothetical protein
MGKMSIKQEVLTEYLRRSYFAVDGLWFMILEGEFSFDKALEMDAKVWRILPKIQARRVKELLGIPGLGLDDFMKAIAVKFAAEEYDYEVKQLGDGHIQVAIRDCPWINILKKAKREHLAPQISEAICLLELQVWLKEFGDDMIFNMECRKCCGDSICIMDFTSQGEKNGR